MRPWGLTGGIGSGKSTVAQTLVACGAALVDTDAIARAHSRCRAAPRCRPWRPELWAADDRRRWRHGPRKQMRRTGVWTDASAKRRLEAILHPLIGQEAQRQAAAAVPPQGHCRGV